MAGEVEFMSGGWWWEDWGRLVDDLVEDLVGWGWGWRGVLDRDVGGGVVEDVDDVGWVGRSCWDGWDGWTRWGSG